MLKKKKKKNGPTLTIYFWLIKPRYSSTSFTILSSKIKPAFLYLKPELILCWLFCFVLFAYFHLHRWIHFVSAILVALVKILSFYVIISDWVSVSRWVYIIWYPTIVATLCIHVALPFASFTAIFIAICYWKRLFGYTFCWTYWDQGGNQFFFFNFTSQKFFFNFTS